MDSKSNRIQGGIQPIRRVPQKVLNQSTSLDIEPDQEEEGHVIVDGIPFEGGDEPVIPQEQVNYERSPSTIANPQFSRNENPVNLHNMRIRRVRERNRNLQDYEVYSPY